MLLLCLHWNRPLTGRVRPGGALPILLTRVGFLCVSLPVSTKPRAPDEFLPTLLTLEGLLPGVDSLMDLETRLLAESFSTRVTFEGLLPGVHSLVGLEV